MTWPTHNFVVRGHLDSGLRRIYAVPPHSHYQLLKSTVLYYSIYNLTSRTKFQLLAMMILLLPAKGYLFPSSGCKLVVISIADMYYKTRTTKWRPLCTSLLTELSVRSTCRFQGSSTKHEAAAEHPWQGCRLILLQPIQFLYFYMPTYAQPKTKQIRAVAWFYEIKSARSYRSRINLNRRLSRYFFVFEFEHILLLRVVQHS